MKLNIGQIIDCYQALCKFVDKDIKLSAQTAWNIDDNIDALKHEVNKFETKRNDLINKLLDSGDAIIADNGTRIITAPGRDEAFKIVDDQISELLNVETNLDISMISEKELPTELTVKDLRALKFMIQRDTD